MLISIKIIKLAFSGLNKPRILFCLLINVKMPTFISRKNSCSAELCTIFLYNSGAGFCTGFIVQRNEKNTTKVVSLRKITGKHENVPINHEANGHASRGPVGSVG